MTLDTPQRPPASPIGQRRARLPLNWPYGKAVEEFRREALAREDFDPATTFVWGQMMAMGLLAMLKAVEAKYGREGHETCRGALVETAKGMAHEMFEGVEMPEDLRPIEFSSLFASWINEVVYASVESARIDGEKKASFDILYCPHQSLYNGFDCRVQRYLVEGLMIGAREMMPQEVRDRTGFDVAVDSTMPVGSPTCHFRLWEREDGANAASAWDAYSAHLADRATGKPKG